MGPEADRDGWACYLSLVACERFVLPFGGREGCSFINVSQSVASSSRRWVAPRELFSVSVESRFNSFVSKSTSKFLSQPDM